MAIREMAPKFAAATRVEPVIIPDFHRADLNAVVALIFVAINRGRNTEESVFLYLEQRKCPFDLDTIRFLLNQFNGNDFRHCLWCRDKAGRYELLGDEYGACMM